MHILEEKIRSANSAGRTALIPFLTSGFPDEERFWRSLKELDENGADIIEIGVPFSDPVADGPVVEEASRLSLKNGFRLETLLEKLRQCGHSLKAGLVLMGYYNPFLQFGLEKLADEAASSGISGFIVPDLPHEEAGHFRTLLAARGIALIPLVGLNTSAERMALYAGEGMGYVYLVSVMGTTGERGKVAPEVPETIRTARRIFTLPLALGFGLKKPGQLDILPADARPDAAVFGSALLTHLAEGRSAADFMRQWL